MSMHKDVVKSSIYWGFSPLKGYQNQIKLYSLELSRYIQIYFIKISISHEPYIAIRAAGLFSYLDYQNAIVTVIGSFCLTVLYH